jgi:hypothetical protein
MEWFCTQASLSQLWMRLFLLTLQLNPFLHKQPANPDLSELASVLCLHTKTTPRTWNQDRHGPVNQTWLMIYSRRGWTSMRFKEIPMSEQKAHSCTTSYSHWWHNHRPLSQPCISYWPHQNQLKSHRRHQSVRPWRNGEQNEYQLKWNLQLGSLIANAPTCSPLISFGKGKTG